MASSFFVLLDDIVSVLDDVAALSKIATKKTSGVLGDDLALNSQQVSGVAAERELPVVWAVAKGSFVNKAILVPTALALSVWAPALIQPLLILGGAYLCFEGAEKILEKFLHPKSEIAIEKKEHIALHKEHLKASPADLVKLEKDKIKGAVRTDFILSAEIVVISLGTVAAAPFAQQVGTLIVISLLMTIGVYGLVAAIVKMDDAGLALSLKASAAAKAVGKALLVSAPILLRILGVVGTAAMFTVGGGILAHAWETFHHWTSEMNSSVSLLAEASLGFVAGAALAVAFTFGKKIFSKKS